MTQRDILIELLDTNCGYVDEVRADELADHLIENNVMVLPCKVGDKVWIIKNNNIHGNFAVQYHLADNKEQSFLSMHGEYCNFTDFGKTVFLTKKEAEQALLKGVKK